MIKMAPDWLTAEERVRAVAVSGPDAGDGFPPAVFVRLGPDGPFVADDQEEAAAIRRIWPAAEIRRKP